MFQIDFVNDDKVVIRSLIIQAEDHWSACTQGLSLLSTLVKDATDFQVTEVDA